MINKDKCTTCHGVALVLEPCPTCGIQFDESKLPPWTPLYANCPKCGLSTSWWDEGKTPVNSDSYCQQVYRQTIKCGHLSVHIHQTRTLSRKAK
jgi:hypothetical protein